MVALLVIGAILAGCSAVSIETGATPEEEIATSEVRAREARSIWARNFNAASEYGKAALLRHHIDSTAARFLYVGNQFADEWEKGNQGRGQSIPAEEMREVIDNTLAKDRPMIIAWEENMEYGWEWVRDSSRFDNHTLELFSRMVDHYYDCYSVAFFPREDVSIYREELYQAEVRLQNLSRDLGVELEQYR